MLHLPSRILNMLDLFQDSAFLHVHFFPIFHILAQIFSAVTSSQICSHISLHVTKPLHAHNIFPVWRVLSFPSTPHTDVCFGDLRSTYIWFIFLLLIHILTTWLLSYGEFSDIFLFCMNTVFFIFPENSFIWFKVSFFGKSDPKSPVFVKVLLRKGGTPELLWGGD